MFKVGRAVIGAGVIGLAIARKASDVRSSEPALRAEAEENGVDGLLNLFGIESPGLTSSLAIAREIANMVDTVQNK